MDMEPARRRTRRRGFTIIELLVVVSIIAIIVSLIVSAGTNLQARGMEEETRGYLEIIQRAVDEYRDQTGTYPTGGMSSMIPNMAKLPECQKMLQNLPPNAQAGKDAFDRPISFQATGGPGGTAVVISPGRDGIANTADDLSSADR